MRPGNALASSQPASRYAAAYEAELRGLGGRKLSAGLWRLAPSRAVDDDNLDSGPWIHAADAEAVRVLMYPLCRAGSLRALLNTIRSTQVLPSTTQWILRYEPHHRRHRAAPFLPGNDAGEPPGDADASYQALCAVSSALNGDPWLGGACADVLQLHLLRTARLWYLCRASAVHRSRAMARQRLQLRWSTRPYSFSAATDMSLARLAIGMAVRHRRRTQLPVNRLLDPCCGSGTVLAAAFHEGIDAVGVDMNPIAVKGARANLEAVFRPAMPCNDESQTPPPLRSPAPPPHESAITFSSPRPTSSTATSTCVPPGTPAPSPPHSIPPPPPPLPSFSTSPSSPRSPASACHLPLVIEHDCSLPDLPSAATDDVTMVVASLPWGRNQRLLHADHLPDMLAALAAKLPNSTFSLLAATALSPQTLARTRLSVLEAIPIGSTARPRCVLHVCTVKTSASVPARAQQTQRVALQKQRLDTSETKQGHTPSSPSSPTSPASSSATRSPSQRQEAEPLPTISPQARHGRLPKLPAPTRGDARESHLLPPQGTALPATTLTSNAAEAQEERRVVHILTGGGLRAGGSAIRLPSAGDTLEVQCRLASGRRSWVPAKVLITQVAPDASASDAVLCAVCWMALEEQKLMGTHEDEHFAQEADDEGFQILLALHCGPNWRFMS